MASSPITSWQIDVEKAETVRFYFLGLQMVTAARKFKRHLLLGRKAMTNLDSVLKSGDVTLPTEVFIVKLWFFQSCTDWTIKKAES